MQSFRPWLSLLSCWKRKKGRREKSVSGCSEPFECNLPDSGNTPNTVSAPASTYPTASSQLILVEGDIPGQEG